MKRTLNKTAIIALACLSLTLGACEALKTGIDTGKALVYSKGAAQLTDYCAIRDETIATGLVSRINAGLANASFAGSIDLKVNCP